MKNITNKSKSIIITLKTIKMKKLFILLLFLTGIANAQIINIPDANFKAKLLAANVNNGIAAAAGVYIKIDTNNDGQIQNSEALNVTELYISNSNISSLVGIRSFLNLGSLNCSNNQLSTLSVLNMNSLFNLICHNNNLTAINFSGTNIRNFYCENNQLSSLNVGSLVNLSVLNCRNNILTNLSFGSIALLTVVNCSNNLLTTLNATNFSNNINSTPILDCSTNQLTSLILGQNITNVNCKNNLLSSLDYSYRQTVNGSYNYLICANNQLTSLNITGSALNDLDCSNNLLYTLDLTGITMPTSYVFGATLIRPTFDCSFNQLTNLIFNNSQFNFFKCTNNPLTTVNLSGSIIYDSIDFSNNQLITFTFGTAIIPPTIKIKNNLLTTIDISNHPLMSSLDVSNNNLSTIFAKNGRNEYINFTNNPNLTFICADEEQISSLASVALPTTCVNSYCNFVPGGIFNTISGVSRFDGDNNGCSPLDLGFNNLRINISDGIDSGATFTNATGNYNIFTQSLDYLLTPVLENPAYFNITPTSSVVTFASNNNLTNNQDFCVTANGVHNDLEIVLFPIGRAQPAQEAEYILEYKNKGNQLMNGNVALTFDDDATDFASASPAIDNQTLNNLTWNYSNLLPFESRTINLKLLVNSGAQTPPISTGSELAFVATVNPVINDETPLDNVFSFIQTVDDTYIPHFITCLEGNNLPVSAIGQYLHYSVQFDNTGTSTSRNIVVKQVIDTSKFDINTLQVMNSSAAMRTVITNNVVEFIFENINLNRSAGTPPVGGHGDVLFKIKTKPNLSAGSSVMNTAGIYFDYNFPVNTNMATTTFATLSSTIFTKDDSISVYPNPANLIVNFNSNSTIKSIELYDVQGRILETQVGNVANLDISNKTNGIYFVKITTDKGSKVEKIVKK